MGFKVFINGELAREFEGEHQAVQSVQLRSAQGGEGVMNVPNHIDRVDVVVELRNTTVSNYLDMIPYTAGPAATKVEEANVEAVEEGRRLQAEMDEQEQQLTSEGAAVIERNPETEMTGPVNEPDTVEDDREADLQTTDTMGESSPSGGGRTL